MPIYLKLRIYSSNLEFLCPKDGRFVYSVLFIYLICNSFNIFILIYIYRFFTIYHISQYYYINFVAQIASSFKHWMFLHLVPVSFEKPIIVEFLSTFFFNFLAQDGLNSTCILPTLALESTNSPRKPSSFCWRIALETKTWVMSLLMLPRCHCF